MKRLLPAIALLLSACGDGEITELARAPAPHGGFDVVVGRMKAGETEPYLVVMTKPGENPGKGARLLLADKGGVPGVTWRDAEHLTIRCDGARIWSYRNFWTSPNGRATVAIGLECGQQGWDGK